MKAGRRTKYIVFNVEIDPPIKTSLPKDIKKSIILTNEYIKVVEYEYNNLRIFAIVPRKGFGIIVSDEKERFIEKLNKAVEKAKKRAEKYSVDGKVCIPYKSHKRIEISCVDKDKYLSSEITNILFEFYD